jgi:pyruvate dehydrogenase E2 component (dihydrolipoamide acetyltransferase)
MLAGARQAAPVTLTTKADATNLVSLKRQYQQEAVSEAPPPGYTDLIVKLVAAALQQHPDLKSQWCDDKIFVPDATHIAFAVDTDAGLLAPVIRDVPDRTVRQVATESRRLTALAHGRRLHADQLREATFTVSNLGGLGIDAFTPILHLPQSAILGVGRVVREPVVMHDDAIVPREMMALSLTFDHRVLDGAPAARFLDALRQLMADPFDALGG